MRATPSRHSRNSRQPQRPVHKARFSSGRSSPVSAAQTAQSAARSPNFHKRIFFTRARDIWGCGLVGAARRSQCIRIASRLLSLLLPIFVRAHILPNTGRVFFGVHFFFPFPTAALSRSRIRNGKQNGKLGVRLRSKAMLLCFTDGVRCVYIIQCRKANFMHYVS